MPNRPISFLLVLVLLAAGSGCQDRKDVPPDSTTAEEQTEVAAQPTAMQINHTPAEAIRTFIEGIVEGDRNKSASATIVNERVLAFIDAEINLIQASNRFARTDNEFFGVEGGMPVGILEQVMLKKLENSPPVVIDDDHVQCSINPANPMELTRTADGWKVDLTGEDSADFIDSAIDTFTRSAQLYDGVRQSIIVGDIKTRDEVRKEMGRLKNELGL